MALLAYGKRRPVYKAAVIALFLAMIELAVNVTSPVAEHWHYALHRLYYLDIIAGGLMFGWRGGLVAALLSSALYLSHNSATDSPDARNALDQYLESVIFCLVGLLAGVLSDRERALRKKAEQTGEALRRVHQELQNNMEHLKRASRLSALGHMSAGLAHEIRNPLAGIEGAAAILMEANTREASRTEFLGIIQKECRRVNKLVTNFLEFARPRMPELQAADVASLIQSVVEMVGQTGGRHRANFSVIVAPDVPPVLCDAEQVKQVLLNLILNAVQAIPEGGEVRVSAACVRDFVTIQVADNGPGVSSEDGDSIFDPFFTTKETGTGLGLPTAYQIIEQHGGELKLERNSPGGACFAFTLPLKRREKL